MRRPRTQEDLESLYGFARGPEKARALARQLEAWAAEGTRPGDEVNAAQLLVTAGEELARSGDAHEAVRLFRRAVATGEPVAPDVRCYLHHGLLEIGDTAAARELADDVRRGRPADADVYLFIGEDHEVHGDLREAHRWLTLGARTALDDVDDADDEEALEAASGAAFLLTARRRVRRQLGMAPDQWDLLVPEPSTADGDASG